MEITDIKVFKLKGKGIKHLNRNSYGDLIITLVAESPKSLSKEEKKLVDKLANSLNESCFTRYKSYLKDIDNL